MYNNNNQIKKGTQFDVNLSKYLSYLLRHGAVKENLTIEENGYVDVQTLLQKPWFKENNCSINDIERIVTNNNKKRFTLMICERTGLRKLRANQGHSMRNISDLNLYKYNSENELNMVVHGTYYKCWEQIKKEGLRCMNRNHIHFTYTDVLTNSIRSSSSFSTFTSAKISGFRENAQILIYINFKKAMNDGIQFYRSENNVILSSGINNTIPIKYFHKVIDRKTNTNLSI